MPKMISRLIICVLFKHFESNTTAHVTTFVKKICFHFPHSCELPRIFEAINRGQYECSFALFVYRVAVGVLCVV